MYSMLWWSLFSRSMKTLTALTFSQRMWKGWAWHDETPREDVHFPASSKAAQVTDLRTVHAVTLEESNYFNSFYYVTSMCPVRWPMYEVCMRLVSRDALIVFRLSLGRWRRTDSNIGGVRSEEGAEGYSLTFTSALVNFSVTSTCEDSAEITGN